MATYLVTGGAGFIGSHIVDALLARGDRVRVLDNFSTGRRENLPIDAPALEIVEGDITDLPTVQQTVEDVDFVLHQAALVSVTQSMIDPAASHAVNVTGTLNVLMAARSAGVKRVVMASSCAVYGDNNDLPLKETAALNPLSPYAASKQIGEVYCQMYQRAFDLPTVCLRYFNIYGPRQNPNGDYAAVIPKFAARMKAGQPPVIYGDGRQTRDFVHVSDVARANLLACDCDQAIGQIFNVASAQRISLLEIVDIINILLGTRLQPKFEPARSGDIRHSSGNAERLMNLGFRISKTLPEGLRQLVA